MKMRFVITHINRDGLRTLTRANQGRNHYDFRTEAEHAMKLFEPGLGDAADTLRVVETKCYDHGDAIGVYVDHLDGDPCPHGKRWRVVNGEHTIDCKEDACPYLYHTSAEIA